MQLRSFRVRSRRAFTLIEILGVCAIIGILASMVIVSFAGAKSGVDEDHAKTCAMLLNTAKIRYERAGQAVARTAWGLAGTGEDKYQLLKGQLGPSAADSLNAYLPEGYTVTFGSSIGERVVLKKGTTVVTYP